MITCGRKKKKKTSISLSLHFFFKHIKIRALIFTRTCPDSFKSWGAVNCISLKIQPKSLFRIPNQRNYEDISVYVWVFFINWWGSSSACCLFAVSNQLSKYLLQVPCGLALHPVSLLIQMMVWYCPLARTQTAYKYTHPHGLAFSNTNVKKH